MQVGAKLKNLRKQKSVTLKQMAERTGLSIGYLSNIERDLTSPTLDHMEAITKALNTPLASVLEAPLQHTVVRKEERVLIYDIPERAKWEYVVDPSRSLTGICTTLAPHGEPMTSWGHNFDEVGIVAEGEVLITMAGSQYRLHAGDAIFVPHNTGHTAENDTDEVCICYWVSPSSDK